MWSHPLSGRTTISARTLPWRPWADCLLLRGAGRTPAFLSSDEWTIREFLQQKTCRVAVVSPNIAVETIHSLRTPASFGGGVIKCDIFLNKSRGFLTPVRYTSKEESHPEDAPEEKIRTVGDPVLADRWLAPYRLRRSGAQRSRAYFCQYLRGTPHARYPGFFVGLARASDRRCRFRLTVIEDKAISKKHSPRPRNSGGAPKGPDRLPTFSSKPVPHTFERFSPVMFLFGGLPQHSGLMCGSLPRRPVSPGSPTWMRHANSHNRPKPKVWNASLSFQHEIRHLSGALLYRPHGEWLPSRRLSHHPAAGPKTRNPLLS